MSEGWIDRYRLQELLSRGGMGEVWRAEDEVLDRPVAVKLLYEDLDASPDRERFLREARAAARLAHPNIVATHDVGEWDGRPYLVMEFLQGRTLAEELEEHGPFPIEAVRELGAQVAAALEGAHEAGIVHRDLKPANLILTSDGELKLIDFGLAWLLDESSERLTPAHTAMGTVTHLAPELAIGGAVDERSDLYSLGCVLYELACGRPPFQGSMAAIVLGHVQDEPDPPSTLRPDIPADLESLILHLLAKEPEHRPPDAGEVRRRLLGVSGSGQIKTIVIPQPRNEVAPVTRRTAGLLVGGLVVAVVLGLLVWWALPGIGQGLRLAVPAEASTPSRSATHQPSRSRPVAEPERPESRTHTPARVAPLGLPATEEAHPTEKADNGANVPSQRRQPHGQPGVRGHDPARTRQPVPPPADRGGPQDGNPAHDAGRHHARR
ncbi:serine/threonine-protein kinase [Flindersiella endophytica]